MCALLFLYVLQCFFQSGLLFHQLGELSAGFAANAVFQLFQALLQLHGLAALIPGGDQGIEAAAQVFVRRHRQITQTDEARPAEHTALHPQKLLSAVGGGKLRHGKTGFRLIRPKFPQRNAPSAGAFNGDAAVVPNQLYFAGHGAARPGGVVFLVREGILGTAGFGIDAIEHGQKKGAPGALSPFVGGRNHVQPRVKGQGLAFQLAEGSGHGFQYHGSSTSRPSSSVMEIAAANEAMSLVFSSRLRACSF